MPIAFKYLQKNKSNWVPCYARACPGGGLIPQKSKMQFIFTWHTALERGTFFVGFRWGGGREKGFGPG
jgi:hypothetical protein